MQEFAPGTKLKAITWGLPIKIFIAEDGVPEVYGFFSPIYTGLLAPLESIFSSSFTFMVYENCNYFQALWYIATGKFNESN